MAQFDFRTQVQDPFTSALRAAQLGSSLQQAQVQRQQAGLKQQALQQQLEQKANFQRGVDKILQGGVKNATAEDFAELAFFTDKDTAKTLQDTFESLDKNKQRVTLQSTSEVVSALAQNRPDIAERRLLENAERLIETNLPENIQTAGLLKAQAELARTNPEFLEFDLKYKLAALPNGKEYLESILKIQAAPAQERKASAEASIKEAEAKFAPEKFGADLGLTKAQIEQAKAARRASDEAAKKSGAEATRLQSEVDQIAGGIIPANKRPDAEAKMRKEYSDQTKSYQDVKESYSRILASDKTAAGDLALIFNYMKMLDPGSVVRESEFATAENAAGVPDRVRNTFNKALTGVKLGEDQRKDFRKQAQNLFTQAKVRENKVRTGIERIAKGYGLNTENIFFEQEESAPTAIQQQPGARPTEAGAMQPRPSGTRSIDDILRDLRVMP